MLYSTVDIYKIKNAAVLSSSKCIDKLIEFITDIGSCIVMWKNSDTFLKFYSKPYTQNLFKLCSL